VRFNFQTCYNSTVNSNPLDFSQPASDEYERLKSVLVSLISHELRTPLTYVSASLEMIEIALETPDNQAEIRRFLNIIAQGVKQLNSTIDELLLFSSLENASPRSDGERLVQVNVQELVCEVINTFKPSYQAKKQVFEVSIQEDLPPLTIDPGKLSEILVQLISNAIKFTPVGGHVRIIVIQLKDMLKILVSDNGPGVPEDIRERIFNPFYQREDHLIREHGGLGLGLTLVQRLCHAIGAQLRMDVEEPPYSGTTFILDLPQIDPTFQKNQDMRQVLEEVRQLAESNAEKEEQLVGLKGQLLHYTEALRQASRSSQQQQETINRIYEDMLQGLAFALESRDAYTRGRSRRMALCADLLAQQLNLDPQTRNQLEKACVLCDIGYIGIPDQILHKPQRLKLNPAEITQIQSHTRIGSEMLRYIEAFEPIAPIIMSHHENWDGSGYPQGLHAQQIPLLARIIRLTDAFEAMISDRAYRRPLPPEKALQQIEKGSGTQFDPELVTLFSGLWHSGQLQTVISAPEFTVPEKGKLHNE
jgi:HD-GYP domain-containing protein (c-di-GMP phosphodiesterase class II)/nitrogen-specific signal transduction histidine kinase